MAAENGLDNEVEDIKQAEGSASCEGQDKEDAGIKDGDNAELFRKR